MITTTTAADRAWVATRNGLFELRLQGGNWAIAGVNFPDDPVTMVRPPDHCGRMLVALNLPPIFAVRFG